MAQNNVIDMTARRREQIKGEKKKTKPHTKAEVQSADVKSLQEFRQEVLSSERRKNKRTILSHFLGAFIVVPQVGLQPVTLYDISDGGMGFDVNFGELNFKRGQDLTIRIYLTQDTYFPLGVIIRNVREVPDEGVWRYGTRFIKTVGNQEALYSFIAFVETISAHVFKDNGDKRIYHRRG